MPFVYSAEGDIETVVMNALQSVFQSELITNVPLTDALRLNRLDAAPLQDDPTAVAPFVIYAPAYELDREDSDLGIAEIGGGVFWSTPWRVVCGTPRRTTKAAAYSAINELSRRVERVLMRHYDLSGVLGNGQLTSADGSEYVEGNSPADLKLRTKRRVYGGDREFYGESVTYFVLNFYRARDW